MRPIIQLSLFGLRDLLRSKWIIIYAFFIMLVTEGLFRFGGDTSKILLSLMSMTILLVPLVSVVFGTMNFYNLREFIQLLLTQPVKRENVYLGIFISIVTALIISFILGISIPYAIDSSASESQWGVFLMLLVTGSALTIIFVGIVFLMAVIFSDKGKRAGAFASVLVVPCGNL